MVSKKRLNNLFTYIVVLYFIIMSGSVFHYAYMGLVDQINTIVTAIAVTIFAGGGYLKEHHLVLRIRKNICDIFVFVTGIALIFVFVIVSQMTFFAGYLALFSRILLPWIVVKRLRTEDIENAFIRIVLTLATISLVLYYIPSILDFLPQTTIDTNQWDYENYFIYARYSNRYFELLNRNIGIFWEPGMYQGYIILASLLISLRDRVSIKTTICQAILWITLFTVQSTTGYMLLIPCAFLYILSYIRQPKLRVVLTVIIMGIAIILFLDERILVGALALISPDIVGKVGNLNNLSTSTRLYGMIVDLQLALRNPFGCNMLQLEDLRSQLTNSLGYIVDGANINTTFTMMLYHGIIPGAMYFLMMVKACCNLSKDILVRVMLVIICFILINTEPYYLTIMFTLFFMMYANRSVTNNKL